MSGEKEVFLKDDYVPPSLVTPTASSSSRTSTSTSGLRSYADSSINAVSSILEPVLSPFNKALNRFDAWREHLDLPYPGQVDQLGRESKSE